MSGPTSAPITFAITGASGAPYAVRLLAALNRTDVSLFTTLGFHLQREQKDPAADLDAAGDEAEDEGDDSERD